MLMQDLKHQVRSTFYYTEYDSSGVDLGAVLDSGKTRCSVFYRAPPNVTQYALFNLYAERRHSCRFRKTQCGLAKDESVLVVLD